MSVQVPKFLENVTSTQIVDDRLTYVLTSFQTAYLQ